MRYVDVNSHHRTGQYQNVGDEQSRTQRGMNRPAGQPQVNVRRRIALQSLPHRNGNIGSHDDARHA